MEMLESGVMEERRPSLAAMRRRAIGGSLMERWPDVPFFVYQRTYVHFVLVIPQ